MTTKIKPTYEIANFLPMSLRRQIVARTYRWNEEQGSRVCATGRCPLGWLFADIEGGEGYLVPDAWDIADRIILKFPKRLHSTPAWKLASFAQKFISAWDGRHIRNLRKALGVPK